MALSSPAAAIWPIILGLVAKRTQSFVMTTFFRNQAAP